MWKKTDSTLDAPITIEKICKTIKELKTNKGTGHDSITNEMLKEGQSVISPFLVTLFNKILETQNYPEEWSIGIITPLHNQFQKRFLHSKSHTYNWNINRKVPQSKQETAPMLCRL